MKKLRIISDGTPVGTQLGYADGEVLDLPIRSIDWSIRAGENAIVRIEFANTEVVVIGELPFSKTEPEPDPLSIIVRPAANGEFEAYVEGRPDLASVKGPNGQLAAEELQRMLAAEAATS